MTSAPVTTAPVTTAPVTTGGGGVTGGTAATGGTTGGGSGAGGTTGGGAAANGATASLTGGGTNSVSQSLADAAQEAVGGRAPEPTCAASRSSDQQRWSQNNGRCQPPGQAYGSTSAQPLKAPPAPPANPLTYSAWAYGFGDYEVHQNVAPNSGSDVTRRTATGGALAGFDLTRPGIVTAADSLMLGFMSGYSSASMTFGDAANTRMMMSGTTVGGYAKYFNGPFQNETFIKADLFNLNQNQLPDAGVSGSTAMNVYTVAHNVSYRFNYGAGWWWEPTAGAQYMSTQYGGNAANLFLSDGFDWQIQGGARAGTSFPWQHAIVSTTVTGLAYSDVVVRGFVLNDAGLPPTAAAVDQGKLRGQGIVAVNVDFQNGVGVFAQGDVRGGQDLVAAGGRLGMRFAW